MECSSWVLKNELAVIGETKKRKTSSEGRASAPRYRGTKGQASLGRPQAARSVGHKPGGKGEDRSIKDLPLHAALHNGNAPRCIAVHAVA